MKNRCETLISERIPGGIKRGGVICRCGPSVGNVRY